MRARIHGRSIHDREMVASPRGGDHRLRVCSGRRPRVTDALARPDGLAPCHADAAAVRLAAAGAHASAVPDATAYARCAHDRAHRTT